MGSNNDEPILIANCGDTLHSSLPYVYVLMHKESERLCGHCFQQSARLLKCSACQLSWYCSKACQKKEWMFHREECKGHQKIAPYIAKDTTRLMLRLVIKSKIVNDHERNVEIFGQRRCFDELMTHSKEIKSDPVRIKEFLQICESLRAFVSEDFVLPHPNELLEFYGKICINTISICDKELRQIGAGLYLGPSLLDHSCRPNAVVIFDGKVLNLKCIEPIYDGQKITISYIELLNTKARRCEELENCYYFQCTCSLCVDNEKDAMMKSSLCSDKKCSGTRGQTDDGSFLPCNVCGQSDIGDIYAQRKSNASTKSHEILQKLVALKSEKKFEELLRLCEECMDDVQGILHHFNVHLIRLLEMAFDSCIELGQFAKAVSYGTRLLEPYRFFLPKFHPDLGIHLMKIGKIHLYLEQTTDALQSLQQAESIIRVTHGPSHALYTDLQELIDQSIMERSAVIAPNPHSNELTEDNNLKLV